MNALSKSIASATTLPAGDPPSAYRQSRSLQDSRILDEVQNRRDWRRLCFILAALLAGSLAGNVAQGVTNRMVPYVVNVDSFGKALAGNVATRATPLSDIELAAAAREWVINTRARYADGDAMKRDILDAYAHTAVGSPAQFALDAWYGNVDPFVQAKSTLVSQDKVHAYAAPVADSAGYANGLHTYRVEWVEKTSNRMDGTRAHPDENWVAVVSMKVAAPSDPDTVEKNPRGTYVYQYDWKQQ